MTLTYTSSLDLVTPAEEQSIAWWQAVCDALGDLSNRLALDDFAHRITGWIDVAYEFQASNRPHEEVRGQVRAPRWNAGALFLVPEIA